MVAPDFEAEQLLVEAGRVRRRAELDADVRVWLSGVPAVGVACRSRSSDDRVAVVDAAAFDRLEARGALAQPLQRLVDRLVVDRGSTARRSEIVEKSPGSNGGTRVERRGERQRLAFLERHVPDVGRVDRLEAALAQRLVDRARNQIVRDVVEDLILEALLDDARRRLARPEPGMRALRV